MYTSFSLFHKRSFSIFLSFWFSHWSSSSDDSVCQLPTLASDGEKNLSAYKDGKHMFFNS